MNLILRFNFNWIPKTILHVGLVNKKKNGNMIL